MISATLLVVFEDDGTFTIQPSEIDDDDISALVEYLDENRERIIAAGRKRMPRRNRSGLGEHTVVR